MPPQPQQMPQNSLSDNHLEVIARYIRQINEQNNGYGKIVLDFRKGQVRFVGVEMTVQFDMSKEDNGKD